MTGKPFTPMFHGQMEGDWARNSVFVMLEINWYARELNWKLDQSGKLYDMKGAPFTEPLVPASPEKNEAAAARQRLQTVLDQLNPAAGKTGKRGNKKSPGKKQPAPDSENANAPDE